MNTCRKTAALLLVTTVAMVCLPTRTVADDSPIYESLSEVPIGRIFFSQEQRLYMDNRRGKGTTPAPPTAAERKASNKNSTAAGFIISEAGRKSIFWNGDFVESKPTTVVEFPGAVRITRKTENPSGNDDAAPEKSSE